MDSEVSKDSLTVCLPTSKGEAQRNAQQGDLTSLDGQGELVMLVEDAEVVMLAMTATLEALKYRVIGAPNGREALRVFEAHGHHIKLIVTDLVMPQMGGLELVRELRRRRCTAPVLLLTGYPLNEGWEEIWGEEVVDVRVKPLSLEQLGKAVKHALCAPRPSRSI